MPDLEGKAAIVTGGAAGLGEAIVRAFVREGCKVLIADVDEARGSSLEAELRSQGGEVQFLSVDVSSETQVEAMVQRAMQAFGRLDCLVNNAGILGPDHSAITETSVDEWERVMAVNAGGTFLSTKYATEAMLSGSGGSIINNASVAGMIGSPYRVSYAASKGAVVQITRALALEYATRGIRVNCICPGLIDTAMMGEDRLASEMAARVVQPMGRLGQPQEVAELVVFLASDKSSFMTGAIVPVDGGYLAR